MGDKEGCATAGFECFLEIILSFGEIAVLIQMSRGEIGQSFGIARIFFQDLLQLSYGLVILLPINQIENIRAGALRRSLGKNRLVPAGHIYDQPKRQEQKG